MSIAWRNVVLLVLLGMLWGSGNPFTKVAVETIPPATVAAGRVGIGMLVLLAIALARRSSFAGVARGRSLWRTILPIVFFSYIVPPLFMSYGQRALDAGTSAIIGGTVPLFTALFSFLLLRRERFDTWSGAGLALGFAGIVALGAPTAAAPEAAAAGSLLLILVAALSYAYANMFIRGSAGADPVAASVVVLALASAVLVPYAIVVDGSWANQASIESAAAVVALGFFTTGWGSYVFFVLGARASPTFLATVNYITPVVGVLLGAFALDETLEANAFAALAAILAGVAAVSYGRARAAKSSP